MNLTRIIDTLYFTPRYHKIERYATHAAEIQQRVFQRLIHKATDTEWGKKYGYASIRSYEDFANSVPVNTYEEIKAYIERMRRGEQNLLWPSEIKWFAKSSGTTNDKSKFL